MSITEIRAPSLSTKYARVSLEMVDAGGSASGSGLYGDDPAEENLVQG